MALAATSKKSAGNKQATRGLSSFQMLDIEEPDTSEVGEENCALMLTKIYHHIRRRFSCPSGTKNALHNHYEAVRE